MTYSDQFTTDFCIAFQSVGGGGGGEFHSLMEDGSLISRIDVWCDDNRMRGIKVYYSHSREGYQADNPSEMFGKVGGTIDTFTFRPGELITKLSIWNTKYKNNTFVVRVRFETSLGRTFNAQEHSSSHKEYALNVGYGAVVGIAGV